MSVRPARPIPGAGIARRHVLVVLAQNNPGVLNRVTSLMRARNFNIESLTASHTAEPGVSHMTLTLHGDDVIVEQATKQLYKLIDVIKVNDITAEASIEHELALIKLKVSDSARDQVFVLADMHRMRIVSNKGKTLIIEVTGSEAQVDTAVALLEPYGIREMVRTGAVAMTEGPSTL